ncbi:MAG TPA: YbdD/YjiX family protein [Methylocystis sp.]|nr:YbdD/YjiX family protein [Methylocystis sp.]
MNCANCSLLKLDLPRLGARLRDGARLMIGQGDYDAYAAHRRARHPAEAVMSREQYFFERQTRRFGEGGAFRCC